MIYFALLFHFSTLDFNIDRNKLFDSEEELGLVEVLNDELFGRWFDELWKFIKKLLEEEERLMQHASLVVFVLEVLDSLIIMAVVEIAYYC